MDLWGSWVIYTEISDFYYEIGNFAEVLCEFDKFFKLFCFVPIFRALPIYFLPLTHATFISCAMRLFQNGPWIFRHFSAHNYVTVCVEPSLYFWGNAHNPSGNSWVLLLFKQNELGEIFPLFLLHPWILVGSWKSCAYVAKCDFEWDFRISYDMHPRRL